MPKIILSSSYLNSFIELVSSNGWFDTVSLDLDPSLISAINNKDAVVDTAIDISVLYKVLDQCNPLFCQPGFGVKMGSSMQLTEHGMLSYVMMGASTHWEALQAGQRYLSIRSGLFHLTIKQTETEVILCFKVVAELQKFETYILEAAIAGTYCLLNHLHQSSPIKQVCLTIDEPKEIAEYQQCFGDKVTFNSEEACIVLDKSLVYQPTKNANPLIFEMAQRECEKLLGELQETVNIADKIRHLLRYQHSHFPNQERMAEQLGLHPRTMRRYLQDLGLSYQHIMEEIQCELAQDYLKQNIAIDEIADLLGYTETTNFLRAFKRWTGKTPAQFMLS